MSCLWQISKLPGYKDIMMDLKLSFICTGVGQGNSTRIPEKCGSVKFLTKLFRYEGGISLSHTNIFSRPLCNFLRSFGVCQFRIKIRFFLLVQSAK